MKKFLLLKCVLAVLTASATARADERWIVFESGTADGVQVGNGKHVVLIAGDNEYRSEEALPQLAKILNTHHGFKCTVLFSQDASGTVDPNAEKNIPGLENLKSADLMVLGLR